MPVSNVFWLIFYGIAMLIAYGAFTYALRYIYEQEGIKSLNRRKIKIEFTFEGHSFDRGMLSANVGPMLANRISKVLYQI
jgi:hypothetical protein